MPYDKDAKVFSNKEAIEWINKMLDDPNIPLWRIPEMYKGINEDQNKMTINRMAKKYCMSKKSIIRIINNNCYLDD